MASKVFKTIDEQLEILKEKNLVISDEEYTKEILLRENYFFLNAYRLVFYQGRGVRKFIDETTFEELYALFTFDRKLRNIMFKNILIVENNYKSIFSYVLSKSYGYKEKDYLSPNNFNNIPEKAKQINDLIRKLKRQIRINGRQHQATSHYMNNYGYIPFWVGVKVVSFGIMSEMFSILKREDQKEIANIIGIDPKELEIYLPILANYRNLCAHEDMLFNHYTQQVIPDNMIHKNLNIQKSDDGEYENGKNDIFALFIILKGILTKSDFKMLMNEVNYELDILSGQLKTINISKILDKMGFPSNYNEITDY